MITRFKLRLLLCFLLGAVMLAGVGCAAPAATDEPTDTEAHDEDADDHHDEDSEDHHDDEEGETIPNDGAVIRIASPEDGATIEGDQVEVTIEIENFEVDGGHWHVSVDGEEWGMIESDDLKYVLRGLEAGEHEISVQLSTGEHQELEDGDSVTITVNP